MIQSDVSEISLDIKSLDRQLTQASTSVGELQLFQKGKIHHQRLPTVDYPLTVCNSIQTNICQLSTIGSHLFRKSSVANSTTLSTSQHDKTG